MNPTKEQEWNGKHQWIIPNYDFEFHRYLNV